MSTAVKLASFAAFLAMVFGGAAAVGAAVGPIDVGGDAASHSAHTGAATDASQTRGLAISQDGYVLTLDADTASPGAPSAFGFTIIDGEGAAVTSFDELHERTVHLIVVSRNLIDYLHLHPSVDAAGHWTIDLPALEPGSYRVYADFQPSGAANLTLAADLTVPGDVPAVPLPPESHISRVDDYTVLLDGTPTIGATELSFTVSTGGRAVRTEPYLGAAGHMIAIRAGDLAFLHVHPHESDTGTAVTFTGEFPSAGTYRLFFDFSLGGVVRTASFTVDARSDATPPSASSHPEGH